MSRLAELAVTLVVWAVPPPPSPAPTVHVEEACPGLQIAMPCYIGDGQTFNDIYLPNSPSFDPLAYEHERGHAFDRLQIDDGERRRIALVMGWKHWRPEQFADFYSGCRMVLDPASWSARSVYRRGGVKLVAARCRLIARAGR